jgi:hypothetical protein
VDDVKDISYHDLKLVIQKKEEKTTTTTPPHDRTEQRRIFAVTMLIQAFHRLPSYLRDVNCRELCFVGWNRAA